MRRCFQGGLIITLGEFDALAAATANFYANVTDPKAAIITSFNYDLGAVRQRMPFTFTVVLSLLIPRTAPECCRGQHVLRWPHSA